MNASDIIRLLNTNHYAPADLDEVNKLCRNFPEFTAAHLLKVRILEVLGYEKKQQLKVAAVYSMDRSKLFQLVNTVERPVISETDPFPAEDTTGAIQFTNDASEQAEVIIEQHAPYANPEPDADLLELDEVPDENLLILDEEHTEEETGEPGEEEQEEENIISEGLLAVEKAETEMEEPGPSEEAVPAIDQIQKPEEDTSNNHLITTFIRGEAGPIRADQKTSLKGDVSLSSIKEHDGFITDTLAQIYVKQGLYAKAIYAYEKLSLKYPEKSAYFAAQIEKIRNINHS